MKRIALYSFLAFCLPLAAGAGVTVEKGEPLEWNEERGDALHYVVLGTATSSQPSIHGVTVTASTTYITRPLQIPDSSLYADIAIRSGSETPYINSASNVASAPFISSASLLFFTRKYDADLYVRNVNDGASVTTIPPYYVGGLVSDVSSADNSKYDFYQMNKPRQTGVRLFNTCGIYRVPVSSGYLVMTFGIGTDARVLNHIGQFISVRFTRQW